jgi:hypothetical protein
MSTWESIRDRIHQLASDDLLKNASRYRVDARVINGELQIENAADEFSEIYANEIRQRVESIEPFVILNQQDRQRKGMDKYNKPIRIFYANLLRAGIKLRVVDGKLRVGGNTEILSPVLQEEIVKRAGGLIELLAPEVPEALQPYFYRLIKVNEVKDAVGIAEQMGISLRQTPVNSGWLIEIQNYRISKEGSVD